MNIDSEKLISLLREVDRTRLEHELAARLTGENFNVFNILRLSDSEVRTHSAFIAELLDPKGSHGQDCLYLKLFLRMLNINEVAFMAEGAKVFVEHSIGKVDPQKATCGRIDIILVDKHCHHIVIENKIYALDQDDQLLRYHVAFPDAPIYYLTLNKDNPSGESLGLTPLTRDYVILGERMKVLNVECVSYREHILHWLEDCYKASVSLPVIRETIFQYENLIKKLTNQACGDKMKEKIIAIITEHPELADAVSAMGEAWDTIFMKVKTDCQTKMQCIRKTIPINDRISILRSYDVSDRADGVWIGFRVFKSDNTNDAADDEACKYSEILKNIDQSRTTRVFPYWNIGLFNPAPFGPKDGFENLPKADIISLYKSEESLNGFVAKLVKQAEDVTEKLFPGAERSIESIQHP